MSPFNNAQQLNIQTANTASIQNLTFVNNTITANTTMGQAYYVLSDDTLAPPGRLAPPREFNPYINASDLLEEFIRFAGVEGVRSGDVLGLPIEAFVKWLVIRACEQDQEEPNVTLELPARRPQPRCLGCQRFMPRSTRMPLHDDRCAGRYFARAELVAA